MTITRLNLPDPRTREHRTSLENPSIPLSNPNIALLEALGAGPSPTGIVVTPQKALTLSAVYACVRVLAESLASLPIVTYKRGENGGKTRAPAHPVYRLLHDRPNPEMTPFQFKETMEGHVALTGNAYAEIEWNGRGDPIALWPITPDRVTVKRQNGQKLYQVRLPDGSTTTLGQGDVLHIPGLGYDGLVGYNPIALMRQTLSIGLATEEFGARFYGNGSRPGGVLTYPNKLSKEAKANLKESWERTQGGLTNAHRVAVLEEGLDWKKIQIDPDDAQFLETRKFQTSEVARIFRVPPHMIGDLDRSTNNNIEQQALEFVKYTLGPWAVRWEEAITFELFSDQAQGTYFAEFLMDALLRGDMESRYNAYNIGRNGGWLSANDIRELENMNPLPGDEGNIYLVAANMMTVEQAMNAAEAAETPQQESGEDQSESDPSEGSTQDRGADIARWRMALAPVFSDAADRVKTREARAIERAEKRGVALSEALDSDHEASVARLYLAPMRALVTLAAPDAPDALRMACADRLAALHATRHVEALRSGEPVPDPLPAVFADLDAHFPVTPSTSLRTAA